VKTWVLGLVREHYADFGPTLVAEKLAEKHELELSRETLSALADGGGPLAKPQAAGQAVHQPRYRRDCLGELVQIDGSEHAWFEGRGPKCTLLVYVDDATGRLMELRFVDSETSFDYFHATRRYLEHYGKPITRTGPSPSSTTAPKKACPRTGPYSVFDKVRQVKQADIVSNKRLGAVLKHVQEQQQIQAVERSKKAPAPTWPASIGVGALPRSEPSRRLSAGLEPWTDGVASGVGGGQLLAQHAPQRRLEVGAALALDVLAQGLVDEGLVVAAAAHPSAEPLDDVRIKPDRDSLLVALDDGAALAVGEVVLVAHGFSLARSAGARQASPGARR
jgi:hypothetical protein